MAYKKLYATAEKPVATNWEVRENIDFPVLASDVYYDKHLYVDAEEKFKTTLNNWEKDVLEEEMQKPDFVAWLRNIDRKKWAIGIPYQMNNDDHIMYPDLLVVKVENDNFVFDLLEPHDPSRNDNLPKAKGLASFAEEHCIEYGAISLIRKINGTYKRLDLTSKLFRDKVHRANSDKDLDVIFGEIG